MKLTWQVEDEDVAKVKSFLDRYRDDPFVQARINRNLAAEKPTVTRSEVWWALVMCRMTSQQRSGPRSPVSRFLSAHPFPVSLDLCQGQEDVEGFIRGVLSAWGGLRFTTKAASDIARNLSHLEDGGWETWLDRLDSLRAPHESRCDRIVAEMLAEAFHGLGPKQSRNLLQSLGLSLWEIPIDSRVTQWLNHFGFPIRLTSGALGDRAYYEFVSEGFQELCKASDVYPCVLDAAIFASFDKGAWNEGNLVY